MSVPVSLTSKSHSGHVGLAGNHGSNGERLSYTPNVLALRSTAISSCCSSMIQIIGDRGYGHEIDQRNVRTVYRRGFPENSNVMNIRI